MFCRHCGTQIGLNSRFCAGCGHEVSDETSSATKHASKSQTPAWFKFLMGVLVAGLLLLGLTVLFREDIAESIEGQLSALRSNKITEAYYSFTSKDFQNVTSLDVFREFVKTYPVFSLNKSLLINQQTTDGGISTIDSTLVSNSGENAQVQYKLIKEGDKWKVLSIKLIESPLLDVKDSPILSELISPVEGQLNALHQQDFSKAYQFVAKEFASDTPIEKFKAFVQNYPVFSTFKKIEFENYSIKDNRADVTVILHSDEGIIPVEYKLLQEDGKWKLWSLKLFLPVNQLASQINQADTRSLFELIEEQLKTLEAGDIKKAYEGFASKEFKNVTSLEDFTTFIQRNPLLTKHTAIDFQNPDIFNEQSKLKVELNDDSQTTTLEYTVGMEDGAWKIWGMRVLESSKTQEPVSSLKEGDDQAISKLLLSIIIEQLEAIRNKDFTTAYHEYTSQGFQKATSLKEFVTFIKSQPALYENASSDLNKLTFNNNIGTFVGTLKDKSSQTYSIEYDLIKEGDRWKILHIVISPASPNPSEVFSDKVLQKKNDIERN